MKVFHSFKTLSLLLLIVLWEGWFPCQAVVDLNADACQNYHTLANANRRSDYVSQYPKQCDWNLRGWYRFQGAAGTQMATSCPPENRCGASYPAWMNGAHPTLDEGIVLRKVCIHKWGKCCSRKFVKIQVKNCGSYYVYRFFGTGGCDIRFCGTD